MKLSLVSANRRDFLALAGLGLLAGCDRQWIGQSLSVDGKFVDGVPNLHKVAHNLYRSGLPTAEGMGELESKLGVKHVISFLPLVYDEKLDPKTSIKFHRVPMNTWNIVPQETLTALKMIGAYKADGPVLIHCEHGSDRTGMMVALYRIAFDGWSPDHAGDEMQHGGFGFHNIWTNIVGYVKGVNGPALHDAVFA